MEELRGLKESRDQEKEKMESRIKELDEKTATFSKNTAEEATQDDDDAELKRLKDEEIKMNLEKQKWIDASREEQREILKNIDLARDERDRLEDDAGKLNARVANLASKKANLKERVEELLERKERAIQRKKEALKSLKREAKSKEEKPKPSTRPVSEMRAVKNAMGYYYTSTSGTDPIKLEQLQDSIRDLLLNRVVDFPVISLLASEFKEEAGRRVFGVCLKILLKQRKTVELINDNFELLLFLLNTSLIHMDLAKASDFITGRIILNVANKIFRRTEKVTLFEFSIVHF